MRRLVRALIGTAVLALIGGASSCSGSNDDATARACKVIVRDCHAMRSESDCIDVIGDLSTYEADCVDCIAQAGCNYFSECQRAVSGCRLPTDIQP